MTFLFGALCFSAFAQTAERIVVSKEDFTLTVYAADDSIVAAFPVALSRNYGDKQKKGDMKTPEGTFKIVQVQNSTSWTHDFGDGKGEIAGAYGPWCFRLLTPPFTGICIHGTHDPNSIGTRATEGCIRLNNDNVVKLHKLIRIGMPVSITPDLK